MSNYLIHKFTLNPTGCVHIQWHHINMDFDPYEFDLGPLTVRKLPEASMYKTIGKESRGLYVTHRIRCVTISISSHVFELEGSWLVTVVSNPTSEIKRIWCIVATGFETISNRVEFVLDHLAFGAYCFWWTPPIDHDQCVQSVSKLDCSDELEIRTGNVWVRLWLMLGRNWNWSSTLDWSHCPSDLYSRHSNGIAGTKFVFSETVTSQSI